MKSLHPTHIKLKENHCGYAVELALQNQPRDKSIFQVGVAAHAVLEAIGKAKAKTTEEQKSIANTTAYELATKGREYDGNPEPPMTMQQAIEGMHIALNYVNSNPMPDDAMHEEPFAYTNKWEETEYEAKDAAFKTLIDYIEIGENIDEDGEIEHYAIVRDYKSSWHITTDMLDNLQRRAQAIVVYLRYPHLDTIKLQVHGLRNFKKIERVIYVQHEHDTLLKWRDDIDLAIKMLQAPQTPSPGMGCYNCPYTLQCQYSIPDEKKTIAEQYAIHHGKTKELEKKLKAMTKEGCIYVDEHQIGYTPKTRSVTVPNALKKLYLIWTVNNGTTDAFMNMLKLTATDAKKILKQLSKNGLDYATLADQTFETKPYSQFSISKTTVPISKPDPTETAT